jgi:biotin-dependent carboxylase-like uncharacterized protein
MDPVALAAANLLVGNPPDAAGLEIAVFPFRLRLDTAAALAITGAVVDARLDGVPLPPDWAVDAAAGATLTLPPPRAGARAYIAVAGGVAVPPVLGARATDLKAGFGGLDGRGLKRGDRLPLGRADGAGRLPAGGLGALLPARHRDGDPIALRVVPAAEWDEFDAAAFLAAGWTVTAEANRQGYRLAGPTLARRDGRELLSHGIVPGTVQVPPSGQPIIQLVDANTCGGYPKIATVIAADLPLVAQAPVGAVLAFRAVDHAEAVAATRRRDAAMTRLARDVARARGALPRD